MGATNTRFPGHEWCSSCQDGQVGVSGCSVWRHMVENVRWGLQGNSRMFWAPRLQILDDLKSVLVFSNKTFTYSKWSFLWSDFLGFSFDIQDKWSDLSQTRRFVHINQKLLKLFGPARKTWEAVLYKQTQLHDVFCCFWNYHTSSKLLHVTFSKSFGSSWSFFRVWFLFNCNKGPEPAQPQHTFLVLIRKIWPWESPTNCRSSLVIKLI